MIVRFTVQGATKYDLIHAANEVLEAFLGPDRDAPSFEITATPLVVTDGPVPSLWEGAVEAQA